MIELLPCLHKNEELLKIPDLGCKAINYVFEQDMVNDNGMWLEFGVYVGGTLNRIAKFTNKIIYGFDSFHGLPEDWPHRTDYTFSKGTFNLNGKLPKVDDNVILIDGWFDHTIPAFIKDHPEPISFIHIDSDIYSSCRKILHSFVFQITNNCIIVFDELVEYPGFEFNEWKAWWEFVEDFDISFEWIGGNKSKELKPQSNSKNTIFDFDKSNGISVSPSHENVAVKIINNPYFRKL